MIWTTVCWRHLKSLQVLPKVPLQWSAACLCLTIVFSVSLCGNTRPESLHKTSMYWLLSARLETHCRFKLGQGRAGWTASWRHINQIRYQISSIAQVLYRGSRNLTCRSISYYSYAWLVCSFVLKCISLQWQDVAKSFPNLGAKWQNVVKKHLSNGRAIFDIDKLDRLKAFSELLSESRVLKTFNGSSLIIIYPLVN